MKNEPRFGAALPDELREPQKIVTKDQWPNIPLIIEEAEALPTIGEALMYFVGAFILASGCFLLLGVG